MIKVNYDKDTLKVQGYYPDDINYKIIPAPYIEIEDTTERINDAVVDLDKNEIVKRTQSNDEKIESKKAELLSEAKALYTEKYTESVQVAGIDYQGGYDSAIKLNAKRTLISEAGLEEVSFVDVNDDIIVLTLEEAKQVCISVAMDYENKFHSYKAKKREINSCTTLTQLNKIVIN